MLRLFIMLLFAFGINQLPTSAYANDYSSYIIKVHQHKWYHQNRSGSRKYGGSRYSGGCSFISDRLNHSDEEALKYIASYKDLVRAFGPSPQRGREHFEQHGCREGRSILFDPIQYVAGYDDLIRHIGFNENEALRHYFQHGYRENRSIDRFCGRTYANIFHDLKRAFGHDEHRLAIHYMEHGFREGRGRKQGGRFQRPC